MYCRLGTVDDLPPSFLFATVVYIPPRANVSTAAQLIADVTGRLDSLCPDTPKFILGDFNKCDLRKTLTTYEQYVTCVTTQRKPPSTSAMVQ